MMKCPGCGKVYPDEIEDTIPGWGYTRFGIELIECECGAIWTKPEAREGCH